MTFSKAWWCPGCGQQLTEPGKQKHLRWCKVWSCTGCQRSETGTMTHLRIRGWTIPASPAGGTLTTKVLCPSCASAAKAQKEADLLNRALNRACGGDSD